MVKEFKLHTYEIQRCVIALIDSHCSHDGYFSKDYPETYQKLTAMLCEMNKLCWEGNDFTITVKAES